MAYVYEITNQPSKLTEEDKENNAREIWSQLKEKGWTLNAVAGVLGNWEYESYLNPGQWQIGFPVGGVLGGVGMGQWTPTSHLLDWMDLEGHAYYEGHWQVEYLHMNNIYYAGSYHGSQWNNNPAPGWTWEEYKMSTATPEECANAFFQQWEQPGDTTAPERMEYARKWYDYLGGQPGPSEHIPVWLLLTMARVKFRKKIQLIRRTTK